MKLGMLRVLAPDLGEARRFYGEVLGTGTASASVDPGGHVCAYQLDASAAQQP